MKALFASFVMVLAFACYGGEAQTQRDHTLLYLTVATKETDGFKRFKRSALVNGIKLEVLGMGVDWLGGDMQFPGGGHKVNLLREALKKYKARKDVVVVFSDSYDVIISGGEDEILKAFYSLKANVVFSSEDFCWPQKSLEDEYPVVLHGYRFLNSGGFIGYAPQIYELLSKSLENNDDDQLYFTRKYLDAKVRTSLNIKLDHQASIFQNLYGNTEDVALEFLEDKTRLLNTVYQTRPIIIHGNGPSKIALNSLGNYLAKSWTKTVGCTACAEGLINLSERKVSEYPKVLIGFFASRPTAFIEEALDKVALLKYPKKRIYIYIYNKEKSHENIIQKWIEKQKDEPYIGLKYVSSLDNVKSWHAKKNAINRCLEIDCDVFFNVDSEVQLDNPNVLSLLISYNRPVLAPVMTQVGRLWSTFWGAVTDSGFYARSTDYMDIVNGQRTGIWNVPHIYAVYVIWRSVLQNPETRPEFVYKLTDSDMAFTTNFRNKNVFMYAVNLVPDYGHLVNLEAVAADHLHNDLWQVAANPADWEDKYLHAGYHEAADPKFINEMPCNDVYWYPVFKDRFSMELIETMENFGVWSGGKNEDMRLNGGYENVPTDDIHMNQVGYEQEWLYILKKYIKPMAEKVFLGYTSEANALMNFVVRYKPTAQSFLRPHHDSSTYTINVSLNRHMIDYEGGGSNFLRQNCSVQSTKMGWAIMHPGRLTHYHEGLPTTKGTRYIMVSFIDP